jgi:hypothetical protein
MRRGGGWSAASRHSKRSADLPLAPARHGSSSAFVAPYSPASFKLWLLCREPLGAAAWTGGACLRRHDPLIESAQRLGPAIVVAWQVVRRADRNEVRTAVENALGHPLD